MDNKTISCPFCFTQSPHGVRICKGCHAKVASIRGISSRLVSIFIDRQHSCLSHYVFCQRHYSYLHY